MEAIELSIPHQIVVTPNDIRVTDLESGERGLALIAGIIPAQTGLAVSRHGGELASRPEDIKLLREPLPGSPNPRWRPLSNTGWAPQNSSLPATVIMA